MPLCNGFRQFLLISPPIKRDCPVHKQWWWFSRCENPVAERSVRRRNGVASFRGATSSTKQLFVNRTIPFYSAPSPCLTLFVFLACFAPSLRPLPLLLVPFSDFF